MGYGLIFFGIRIFEELRFAVYVYFEQLFQKSLSLKILNIFYFIPRDLARRQSPSETAIVVDRGLGGLRNVMYNLVFSIGPLLIETTVLVIVLAFKVSGIMAFLVIALLVIFVVITYHMTNWISRLQTIWYKTSSANFQIMSESLKSQETIRSLGRPSWVVERYSKATDAFIKEVITSLTPSVIMGFIQGVLLAIIVFFVSYSVIQIHNNFNDAIPMLVLVNALILQIITPLVQFAAAYRIFVQGISSSKQLTELLGSEQVSLKIEHLKNENMVEALKIDEATVTLEDNKVFEFNDLKLLPNMCTVVMGRTGSGKSTLARTIAGLVDYDGEIQVAKDCDTIFYMSQSVDIYNTTLFENVSLAVKYDLKAVNQALLEAGFTKDELLELGDRSMGESGSNISGGQRSRIGIARMLYHDASIVVFDEPTASLDSDTAEKIRSTITKLSKDRTIVVVTHDPEFLKIADSVVRIENGKLIEDSK